MLNQKIVYMINFFISFLFFIGFPVSTQTFEGNISFVEQKLSDTVYYTYYIKGNFVRIDSYDRNQNQIRSIIIDLEKNEMTSLNHERKLFINKPVLPKMLNEEGFEIIKTGNTKMINGYRCYQWRVKNIDNNTEIAYWVTEGNFDFFIDMLKLFDETEKTSMYYLQIPNNTGYFPIVSEERTLLRHTRLRLEVLEINEEAVSSNIFTIPSDYKPFNHN